MNGSNSGASVVTQISTAIAGLILVGYGIAFVAGAVIGF